MSESQRAPTTALVLRVSVPAEGELRVVAADLAARVAEYLGPALSDPSLVSRALDEAISQLGPTAPGADLAFEFRQSERHLRIEARCGARTSEAMCSLPA
jgi:hypothetical protein